MCDFFLCTYLGTRHFHYKCGFGLILLHTVFHQTAVLVNYILDFWTVFRICKSYYKHSKRSNDPSFRQLFVKKHTNVLSEYNLQ